MLKRIIKNRNFLIGFSMICIFSSSTSIFAENINNDITNVNQDMEIIDETSVSEKQQLFDIVANPALTNAKKAEEADKLLYEGKNNIEEVETFPIDTTQFGGVNTGVISSPLAPESERVKDIILDPNFTDEQKIDALNRLLYIGKEAEETSDNEITTFDNKQYKLLDITISKQKKSYYCVPACVYNTMRYLTGSSYSQDSIADALGTTSSGTPLANALPYLNLYQHNYRYVATITKSRTAAKANWFNTIYNSNVPVLFAGTLRKCDRWEYDSSSHCMLLTGVSTDKKKFQIGDPYRKWANPDSPSNKYKRYAKRIHNAILLNGNGYIY